MKPRGHGIPLALLRDDSLSLLVRGYGFGAHLWRRADRGARAVPFRLLGREALFVRGEEGVALFSDETRTRRHGAMPAFIQKSLFGHGSVHSLDGDEHRHRKATFVDVLYDDEVQRLLPELERQWQGELDAWVAGGERSGGRVRRADAPSGCPFHRVGRAEQLRLSAVDLPTVGGPDHSDDELAIEDVVNHPVIPDANAPAIGHDERSARSSLSVTRVPSSVLFA